MCKQSMPHLLKYVLDFNYINLEDHQRELINLDLNKQINLFSQRHNQEYWGCVFF